jgi:hypothetical protein
MIAMSLALGVLGAANGQGVVRQNAITDGRAVIQDRDAQCKSELLKNTCNLDKTKGDTVMCTQCTQLHERKVRMQMIPGAKCDMATLAGLCDDRDALEVVVDGVALEVVPTSATPEITPTASGVSPKSGDGKGFVVMVVNGKEASNSCKTELRASTCDIDEVEGDTTKCLECIESHDRKIEAALIPGSKCSKLIMAEFCAPQTLSTTPKSRAGKIQGVPQVHAPKAPRPPSPTSTTVTAKSCREELKSQGSCDVDRVKAKLVLCVQCMELVSASNI